MEEIINSFVSKFGNLSPAQTFSFMIFAILAFILKDTIKDRFKNLKMPKWSLSKRKIKEAKFEALKAHDIFNVIEEVRALTKFHEFENDTVKSKVFHDFMNIMLDEIRGQFKAVILQINELEKGKDELSRDELKQIILKTLVIIVETYCKKAEQHFIKKGISKTDSHYIVSLFEEWRSETRASINSRVNAIFASSFHQTNFARTLAVLELISVSVNLIPKDGIRSFEQMNGKLKSIKY